MPRSYKGVRFQTGRGRTASGRVGARSGRHGRVNKPMILPGAYSRACPACGATITRGMNLAKRPDNEWVHDFCVE
jgi:ribosomal protein L37AE/L43A